MPMLRAIAAEGDDPDPALLLAARVDDLDHPLLEATEVLGTLPVRAQGCAFELLVRALGAHAVGEERVAPARVDDESGPRLCGSRRPGRRPRPRRRRRDARGRPNAPTRPRAPRHPLRPSDPAGTRRTRSAAPGTRGGSGRRSCDRSRTSSRSPRRHRGIARRACARTAAPSPRARRAPRRCGSRTAASTRQRGRGGTLPARTR